MNANTLDRLQEWRHAVARVYLTGITVTIPVILALMVAFRPPPRADASFFFVLGCWAAFLAARLAAPPRLQALTIVALLMVCGALGPYFLGLSPGPFLAGASGVLLSAAIYGRRTALVMMGVLTLASLLAGLLVSSGTVSGLNLRATDPMVLANWVRLTLFAALTVGLLLYVLTGLFERMGAAWQATAEAAERERLEHQQRRAVEQRAVEAQRLEAIGRLAGGVAHDFNNLLVVIQAWVELLPRATSDAERREGLEAIRSAATRAAQLTGQLLSFARRSMVAATAVDVDAFLAAMAKSVRRMVSADIHLDHAPSQVPRALVDEAQLSQVVLNLVVNASDAMPKGGTLTVRAALVEPPELPPEAPDPAGRYVTVTVADTGVGMDQATLARVFEPFFTTKGPGKGTGLGLASVYGIATQSNGFVRAESRLGEGSRFIVGFPVAPPGAAQHAEDRPPVGQGVAARVLLVEDDELVRATLAATLSGAGMKLTEARDVEQAMRALRDREQPFDLLCTDAVMPGRPTHELIAEFRRALPGAPVLVCSGYVGEELVRRGIAEGTVALLPKPFAGATLVAKVRELLGPGAAASRAP